MKRLKRDYYNQTFSHIYVEDAVREHPRTKEILKRFPDARQISIHHYKDVFCRKKQNVAMQTKHPMLILAAKQGRLIYEGAPVCQSFGNEYFYYTSCVMNCIYDCEYCYLKGMYPSGNIVIFVNIEDIFAELEDILKRHQVYLCVSYDTDLMALEDLTGFVEMWEEFVQSHSGVRIEIRTKCGRTDLWDRLVPDKNVIFSFTLSPERIQASCEHGTATLDERIRCIARAIELGFPVRLCFDPIIYCPGWRREYDTMLEKVEAQIDMGKIWDISVGSFRISQDYIKKLRRSQRDSSVVQFPFVNDNGVYHYPDKLMNEMEQHVVEKLVRWIPEDKIFRWKV
ncbi:MAG: radical SAM protein [Lachnospiraceae bacterium]|nr:radical SAM protein [Lachnospiraceae bacterium]